jgi:hypothetical protein
MEVRAVMSALRPLTFAALTFALFLANAATVHGKESVLICTMSVFFSLDPDNGLIAKDRKTFVEGRGLLSCKNEFGFTTEVPVVADLKAKLPERRLAEGEFTFSGNTSPFVIHGELNQVKDHYHAREFSWLKEKEADDPALLLRGMRHDLVLEMKLTSNLLGLRDIHFSSMSLKFDEAAPDLASGP